MKKYPWPKVIFCPWNAVLLLRTRNRRCGSHIPPRTRCDQRSQKEHRHRFLSWTPCLQSDGSTGIGEAASLFVSSQLHPSRRSWCFQELAFSFPLQGKMWSYRNVLKSCLRGKIGVESVLACSQIEFSRRAGDGGFLGEPSEAAVGLRLCWCCW